MSDSAELPYGWMRPQQRMGRSLFAPDREEALAHMRVSLDEAVRWSELGWLSFDPRGMAIIDDPELYELLFIRNLARSGLSDAQIFTLLEDLPRPYCFDPSLTAYSFALGWVQLPPQAVDCDVNDYIQHHLNGWLFDRLANDDQAAVTEVRDRIVVALVEHHRRQATIREGRAE